MNYTSLDDSAQFKVYPKRFLILGSYALALVANSMMYSTFIPIAALLAEIYDLSAFVVCIAPLVYLLIYPILTFPAAYFVDACGTKKALMLGPVLCMLGLSFRLMVNQGYSSVIFGQVLIGIGRPFILNVQPKLISNWFLTDSRESINKILTLILNLSLVLGIFVPGIMMNSYDPQTNTVEEGRAFVFRVLLIQTIVGFVLLSPSILFMEENPPTPPSDEPVVADRQPLKRALKKIQRNTNYVLLMAGFAIVTGIFHSVAITSSFLFYPWFPSSFQVSLITGLSIISGIIGVFIVGRIQWQEGRYKKWIVVCMIGCIISIVLFYPLLLTQSLLVACMLTSEYSFFMFPLIPIMMDLGSQIVYPVSQSISTGVMSAGGNLFGCIIGVLLSLIWTGEQKLNRALGIIVWLVLFVAGLVLVILAKEELNRRKAQNASLENRLSSTVGSTAQDYVPTKMGEIDGDL